MVDVTDTQAMPVLLSCCEKGTLYVRRRKSHELHGPEQTGWCLTLQGQYDPVRENIERCPWCGKEVPDA